MNKIDKEFREMSSAEVYEKLALYKKEPESMIKRYHEISKRFLKIQDYKYDKLEDVNYSC